MFFDPFAITYEDKDHDEKRFVSVGTGNSGMVLVVCYTWRGDEVRVISARKASRKERKQYEG